MRRAAEGYPVEIHVNAPGAELRDALRRGLASTGTPPGLGEDAERHPDRLEHFGITTVEAMSAGAVPVVIGLAGQLETVRHGVDGFHFQTLGGLVASPGTLIDDPAASTGMSRSAVSEPAFAVDFSTGDCAFVDRLPRARSASRRELSRVP